MDEKEFNKKLSENVRMVFGKELRDARNNADLTQEKISEITGLDSDYISMLERGIRQPSLTTVLLLCSALGISGADLVTRVQAQLD
jgi:transcriptional regulator with XRE-family HTH domain